MSQLDMRMAELTTPSGDRNTRPEEVEEDGCQDLASFLTVALQILWHMETFRLAVGRIANSMDPVVVGLQTLMLSLSESAKPFSLQLLRAALPSLFMEPARQRITYASEVSEAFEALLSVLSEAADSRLKHCIEQYFCYSITEMCECTCDEMLEPIQYKTCCAYISATQMVLSCSSQTTKLVDVLRSRNGPICPVPNCSTVMKIHRYLMSPFPSFITVGLVWDYADEGTQQNAVQTFLSRIDFLIDLQQGFSGLTEPTLASLTTVFCASDDRYVSFWVDSNSRW